MWDTIKIGFTIECGHTIWFEVPNRKMNDFGLSVLRLTLLRIMRGHRKCCKKGA